MEYECIDQGISAPNYARLTMYDVPSTETLRADAIAVGVADSAVCTKQFVATGPCTGPRG